MSIPANEELYLKGNNTGGWTKAPSNYSHFDIKGDVSISGNVMGLLDNGAKEGEDGDIVNIPSQYCFYSLFNGSTGITSVSKDFLPATTLKINCYFAMFYMCTSLTKASDLPATTLTEYCYKNMFFGCASLTQAPALPATELIRYCYQGIFQGCASLTSVKINYSGTLSAAPSGAFNSWVNGIAEEGIFYYNGSDTPQTFWFPNDWTKQSF